MSCLFPSHLAPRLGQNTRLHTVLLTALFSACLLAACGGDDGGDQAKMVVNTGWNPVRLGEEIFKDKTLSASGQMSCATCHDAETGHAQTNSLPSQLGGALLNLQGNRVAPGIRYLSTNTAFYFAADGTPTGGFFFDGRADSLQMQAGGPFLNPVEMAMPSKQAVIAKLQQASYAEAFKQVFGTEIFNNPETAYDRLTFALQAYQKEDRDFHSFTSKYDAFLAGEVALSTAELRGLAVYNNPTKGNCHACHPSSRSTEGKPPLFTDFTYDNLGVPRNLALQVNADPNYFDLGLCARPQGDLASRTNLCGAFKVPSLRNVALRKAYFHNGAFTNLRDVLQFYAQRDTNPEKWYPTAAGVVQKFNDLPIPYQSNVNTTEVPFNRQLGSPPAMNATEIDDLLAFLKTLNDGYTSQPR